MSVFLSTYEWLRGDVEALLELVEGSLRFDAEAWVYTSPDSTTQQYGVGGPLAPTGASR